MDFLIDEVYKSRQLYHDRGFVLFRSVLTDVSRWKGRASGQILQNKYKKREVFSVPGPLLLCSKTLQSFQHFL